jgi:hypothetical protein
MDFDNSSQVYLLLMYVYLKAYQEAVDDFEDAVKNIGFADLALIAVEQKLKEKIERVAKETSGNETAK